MRHGSGGGIRDPLGEVRLRSHRDAGTVRNVSRIRIAVGALEQESRTRTFTRARQRFTRWHESGRVVRCALEGDARFDHESRPGTVAIDVADETKSALVQRANKALIVAAVAQRATRRADTRAERRFRDDAALPDRVEQLVLGDDSIPVSHEMNEQIEHLRLDVDDCAGAPQLVPCPIDLEIGESEVQSSPLLDSKTHTWSLPRHDFVK